MTTRRLMRKGAAVCCILSLLMGVSAYASSEASKPALSPAEMLRLGERMYREGILPSGKPMMAIVKGDVPMDGSEFTCTSCHQRSGLGSVEGSVSTPATTGRILYKPLERLFNGVRQNPKYSQAPPLRPAYTDKSLAEALRSGIDPSGREFGPVMPRYRLTDEDLSILTYYLKSLSSDFSPGVSDTAIRFAVVVTDDVPAQDRDALIGPLERAVTYKNRMALGVDARSSKSRRMLESMLPSKELAYRTIELEKWSLKGPPGTWRSQLEEYNRTKPAFALLGGITGGDWKPVHEFCEENRIPCLFPATDYPVVSEHDWYTLYLSKGLQQEGEAAARYLHTLDGPSKPTAILQVVRKSREGEALATGFGRAWTVLGRPAPRTVTLAHGESLAKALASLPTEKGVTLVLWDGPESLNELDRHRFDRVVLSSGYLGKALLSIPEGLRDRASITYPYKLNSQGPGDDHLRQISGRAQLSAQLMAQALMDMRGEYYRDRFLDAIGMMPDQDHPVFEHLSFGPGQRYVSKGCYIVQLSKGANPVLVQKSPWVIR